MLFLYHQEMHLKANQNDNQVLKNFKTIWKVFSSVLGSIGDFSIEAELSKARLFSKKLKRTEKC